MAGARHRCVADPNARIVGAVRFGKWQARVKSFETPLDLSANPSKNTPLLPVDHLLIGSVAQLARAADS